MLCRVGRPKKIPKELRFYRLISEPCNWVQKQSYTIFIFDLAAFFSLQSQSCLPIEALLYKHHKHPKDKKSHISVLFSNIEDD
jgi:hypothetical protein